MKQIFMNFFKRYSFVFGLILFLIILSKLDLGKISENIKTLNSVYLVLALLMTFPMLFNKVLCWNYIKRHQGMQYSLRDSFLMYCSGLYIGLLTPGRMGEIAKALYLEKDGYSMGKSLVSAILDRLTDFAFLLIFLFFGSLFLLTVFQKQILIFILGIIAGIALFIILLKIGLIKRLLKKIFRIFIPKKYQKSWKLNLCDFINDLGIYKFKQWLIIFLITTFSWVFYYLQMYVLAKGVGIDVPFLYLAIAVTVAGFITLLPISISGIGTRDAVLIALFVPFSIAQEQVIVFSALILSMTIFSALIGLICWWLKPIRF